MKTLFVGLIVLLGATKAPAEPPSAAELVFLLQYIGTDYGLAVRDGKVADALEYAEMLQLSGTLVDRYSELRPRDGVRTDLEKLRDVIVNRGSWDTVRAMGEGLLPRMIDALDLASGPAGTPDLQRGFGLYRTDCAACHGAGGGGDGPSAPGMTPPPTSFRAHRMDLISPYQVFNAASFGVGGTAMPEYAGGRTPQELWDVAFFVMTLRDGFDPQPPAAVVPLPLAAVASESNEQLLKRLRQARPGALASEVDYYRANFPRAEAPPPDVATDDGGIQLAENLERAFSRVADKIFPSVVGISVYEKAPPAPAAAPGSPGWREAAAAEPPYPGFACKRTGSGFFVTGDGDILTSARLLTGGGANVRSSIFDVELADNTHLRARVVGVEPTIDLAVLKIDPATPIRPAPIGDSERVRPGQWAIAIGDPPGAARTFATGTIAAIPQRACYQEQLTSTLLQSSIAIEPEGFGGPLVDIQGRVIGLTVPMAALPSLAGVGMVGPVRALPMNLAMNVYRALAVKESQTSPWIGISVLDLNADLRRRLHSAPPTGIYIDDVFEPSPAAKAGIRVGDVLTKMDGNPILGVPDFQRWLYLLGIDASVPLEIVRDGKVLSPKVTIEQRPESATTR